MLPSPLRLTTRDEFASVVRRGRRTKTATVVVHHQPELVGPHRPAVVGFVVSRAVGNSVVRHRVARRLRAQVQPLVADLPLGSGTVVRALPPAAAADSRTLGADVARAFARVGGVRE